MKLIFLIFIFINIVYADTATDEVADKITYALNCNARFSHVSDVEISILKKSSKYQNSFLVAGNYKNVLSISGQRSGMSVGDEFHPQSGSFKGIVSEDLVLKKLNWKVGIMHGRVKEDCLTLNEDDL